MTRIYIYRTIHVKKRNKMTIKNKQILSDKSFSFVNQFIYPYRFAIIVSALLSALAGAWAPICNELVKWILGSLPQASNDISALFLPSITLLSGLIVLDNLTWRGINYIDYKYRAAIKNSIIRSMLEHVLGLSHKFFQENLPGQISAQVAKLADSIDKIIELFLYTFIKSASVVIVILALSVNSHFIFSLIFAIWLIFFLSFSIPMSRRLSLLTIEEANITSIISGQITDIISNQATVRAFSRKDLELSRMDEYLLEYSNTFRKTKKLLFFVRLIQGLSITALWGANLFFLARFYHLKLLNAGDFIVIIYFSWDLSYTIWWAAYNSESFIQEYGKYKESINALMITQDLKDKEGALPLRITSGEIIFDAISFEYPNFNSIFQNLSVSIHKKQKVGLVGYSGGGKSTFINLLMRLYDVTDGSILIDGQNIRDVTQNSLRDEISIIFQEPGLFHRSILDNVRYGKPDATDQEVIQACKIANAHQFIEKLPMGYDSVIGHNGLKLSGGQRQRLAIARAILKDAPILILDEATSQLDSLTEKLVLESMQYLMKGKTVIAIAHRLSTLLSMDRILVFDRGRIVQDGSHEDLLEQEGLYKTLWNAQVNGLLDEGSG